jgi:hypothetical protein
MDLEEIGYVLMNLNDVAQDRDQWSVLVRMVMIFQIP